MCKNFLVMNISFTSMASMLASISSPLAFTGLRVLATAVMMVTLPLLAPTVSAPLYMFGQKN